MTDQEPRPLALVTGASSGIGYELAKQFAEHGSMKNEVVAGANKLLPETAKAQLHRKMSQPGSADR